MVINPFIAVEKKWIYPIDNEKQIQQNGIDVRLNKVFKVTRGVFQLSEEEKVKLDYIELLPDKNNAFILQYGNAYVVEMVERVSIPADICAIVIMRSTLNRQGILLQSALYDSGFKGVVSSTIYPFTGFKVMKGTRVAQIVFMEAICNSLYDGQYQERK